MSLPCQILPGCLEMITENVKRLLSELPEGVELLAAAKERSAEEISEAIRAGIRLIGENYLQDAQRVFNEVRERAAWHFIGHLQTRKVKKVIEMFDMIESVDSLRLAQEIEKCCAAQNKVMPVLIEINSGEEEQKFGVLPKEAEALIRQIAPLEHLRVKGLMTMGPRFGNPEDARPYFVKTRRLFQEIRDLHIPNVEMSYLSMGMTNSYQVAIEEEANLVRIGTKIFGERRNSK
jgi:pyridoxal phosphate enzyme (YggS family)